jgi:hypothetical protein
LTSIESILEFVSYLQNAVEFVTEETTKSRPQTRNDHKINEESNEAKQVTMRPETLEVMKDILLDVQDLQKKLITGYDDSEIVYQTTGDRNDD